MDLTNKAWYNDNDGLYFLIELGPHTNNQYSQYNFGGSANDTKFVGNDCTINVNNLLGNAETISSVQVLSFDLDTQLLAAGATLAGNSIVRVGFVNLTESNFISFTFLEGLDESMDGIYTMRYKFTTNEGRIFANSFRIKIISTVSNFTGHRDSFKTTGGVLQDIL